MRKRIIEPSPMAQQTVTAFNSGLAIADIATVEVTSEDGQFPVDALFTSAESEGWRASQPGRQRIRLLFDIPISLSRIMLSFKEEEKERTQEFSLRWTGPSGRGGEIVRQQWNFSPGGSTHEYESYDVHLDSVAALEIDITPDINGKDAIASLAALSLVP